MAFAILSKAVPKMNVFILSYPMRLLCGMLMLAGFGTLMARYLSVEFDQIPGMLRELAAP